MKQNDRKATFLKPSTRAFIREARKTSGYTVWDWLHGYIYARWPYLYIGVGTGEHPLTRYLRPLWRIFSKLSQPRTGNGKNSAQASFADNYHGKVVSLEGARRLVTVDREITITDLEKVLPYSRAKAIILRNPDHIVALECPCRASRPEPCQPLDVCLIVGEPFAGFIHEHHPQRSRWITREEAVDILRAEHERGHVHHAFFKDAMLGRFYAICNCCSCCCGAMQAWQNGVPMLASSGYVSRIDQELCIGCGECVDFCQFEALTLDEETDWAVVDEERCMGCGVCVSKCVMEAPQLVRAPHRGQPLEVCDLMAEVAATTAPAFRCAGDGSGGDRGI